MKTAASGEETMTKKQSVRNFIFLSSKIDQDGKSTPEIKQRVAFSHIAIVGMNKIWKSKNIT